MLMEFFFVDTPANSDKENSINFILYESRNIYSLYKIYQVLFFIYNLIMYRFV